MHRTPGGPSGHDITHLARNYDSRCNTGSATGLAMNTRLWLWGYTLTPSHLALCAGV